MFTIGIEYLTGYAVATEYTDRDQPEWPPHPARIFMAMAAAYFECGEDPSERDALLWLESQEQQPQIYAGSADIREPATHYVPVNDSLNDARAALPTLRKRQPRTFPRVWLQNPIVYLHWPAVHVSPELLATMNQLCGKVARVGHSSSLVQMWACDEAPPESARDDLWQPDEHAGEAAFRTVASGSLEELRQRFRSKEREDYHVLMSQFEQAKGKERKLIAQQIEEQFGSACPDPVRPVFNVRTPYRKYEPEISVPQSIWDPRLIRFRLEPTDDAAHLRLDILSTLQITAALHKALISKFGAEVPEIVSGHKPDGTPTIHPHCTFMTLPYVSSEYADGHLLGVAIACPLGISEQDHRRIVIHAGQIREITLGKLGRWRLRDGPDLGDSQTLRETTWTAARKGAMHWATVTPIVFDGHPKAKDRAEYLAEVSEMIRTACTRVGLPKPVLIVPSHVSAHLGAPTSQQFPRMQRKDGSQRRHLHARISFEGPVCGPILLGAGRYRGYGLLRPTSGDAR